MSTVAHFFIIIVAQKFVITWLTFSLTFTQFAQTSEVCCIDDCFATFPINNGLLGFFHDFSHIILGHVGICSGGF